MTLREWLGGLRDRVGWSDRRTAQLVTLLVLVQLAAGPLAMAATSTYFAGSGATYQTDSGLAVELQDDRQIESGNPFPTSDSVELKNVTLRSTNGGAARLDEVPADSADPRVVVSNLDGGSGQGVTFVHPSTTRVGVAQGNSASQITINGSIGIGDGARDLQVSAASSTTVLVDTNGKGVTAVDSGGNTIDEATIRPSGIAEIELSSGTTDVYLESSASQLFVFNETSSTNLVKDGTGIRVRFFREGTDDVIEKNVTDGTVDLAQLQSDEDFVVTVRANETQYHYRRIPIESLQEQQEVYLLPKGSDNATVDFSLTDRTGRFQNPTLRVEKPIRKDFDSDSQNETRYQTVVGDTFGTSGSLTLNLERNERYRLVVKNQDGERRVLGSFTPDLKAQQVPLTIAQVQLAPDAGESGVATDAELVEQADGSYDLRTLYEDANNQTSEVTITVTNSSNATVIGPTTFDNGPYGRLVNTYDVNGTPENETYTVEYEAIRNGETLTLVERIGNISPWNIGYLSDLVSSLTAWVALLGLAGLMVIRAPRIGAVATVVVATIFATLGFISVGPVPLGIAGATAILFVVSRGTGQ